MFKTQSAKYREDNESKQKERIDIIRNIADKDKVLFIIINSSK